MSGAQKGGEKKKGKFLILSIIRCQKVLAEGKKRPFWGVRGEKRKYFGRTDG